MLAEKEAAAATVAAAAAETTEQDKRNDDAPLSSSASLEDEVERAAAKVFARLEEKGVSFGVMDPSLDFVKDLVGNVNHVDDETMDESGSETESGSEDVSSDNDPDGNMVESEGEESGRVNIVGVPKLDLASEQGNDSMPQQSSEEASSSRPLPNRRSPYHPPKENVKPRSVPFRSMRKAFSRATGLHGLITPSSVQLHQRELRNMRKGQQRQQHRNTDGNGRESPAEITSLQGRDDDPSDNSSTEVTSPSRPHSSFNNNQGTMFKGTQQHMADSPPLQDISSTESTTMDDSWGSHYDDDAEGLAASSSSSWSSTAAADGDDILEPPHLPDMD